MQNEIADSSSGAVALLMRRGRFTEALHVLQTEPSSRLQKSQLPVLGDLLQRTGKTRHAHDVTLEALKTASGESLARCHWTLGNVSRELGDGDGALRHFQHAAKLVDNRSELACWVQLRLMATVENFAGTE